MLEGIVNVVEREGWKVYQAPEMGTIVEFSQDYFNQIVPVSGLELGTYLILPKANVYLEQRLAREAGVFPALVVPQSKLQGLPHKSHLAADGSETFHAQSLWVKDSNVIVMSVMAMNGGGSLTAIKMPLKIAEEYFQRYFTIYDLNKRN